MSKFKVGDRVRVVNSTVEDYNGAEGRIDEQGRGASTQFDYWDWWVILDDMDDPQGFDNRELELAPTGTETGAAVADASIFVGIERRIMKSGDTRFLEGIDEPMGIETASYINNLSIELHNTQKVADAFAQKADELTAARERVTAVEARNDTLKTALELIIKLGDDYRDGEGIVGINFTLATILKAAREALGKLPANAPETKEGDVS